MHHMLKFQPISYCMFFKVVAHVNTHSLSLEYQQKKGSVLPDPHSALTNKNRLCKAHKLLNNYLMQCSFQCHYETDWLNT